MYKIKTFANDELKRCETQITSYIMNHSSKNGDIEDLQSQYDNIFRMINI